MIVDCALGKLADATAERLRAHAVVCPRCRELFREWADIAAGSAGGIDAETGPGAATGIGVGSGAGTVGGSAGGSVGGSIRGRGAGTFGGFVAGSGWTNAVAAVAAPPRLRARVLRAARVRQAFRRWRRYWREYSRRFVPAASAGLVFVLFIVGLMRVLDGREPIPAVEIKPAAEQTQMLWQPGAAKYTAIADSGNRQPISGEVWINARSGEMLLILNGLGPLYESEYQVWGLREDWLYSYGLLTSHDGIGYLYIQKQRWDEPEQIIVSVEPKGGSRYPTGPEAIRIGLSR